MLGGQTLWGHILWTVDVGGVNTPSLLINTRSLHGQLKAIIIPHDKILNRDWSM